MSKKVNTGSLVGLERCLEIVFPDLESRPCRRTFLNWRDRGWIPYRKIGGRVFYDPKEVREEIDLHFMEVDAE